MMSTNFRFSSRYKERIVALWASQSSFVTVAMVTRQQIIGKDSVSSFMDENAPFAVFGGEEYKYSLRPQREDTPVRILAECDWLLPESF